MSQEAVDLVTRGLGRTYTTDNLAIHVADFHPDLVYHPRADEPDPSPHVGRDAYAELIRGFLEAFSQITFEVQEVIDAGDRVIASTVLHGQVGGGAEVTDAYVFVYEIRDGLIVEGWEYHTLQEALEAVGMSEHPA